MEVGLSGYFKSLHGVEGRATSDGLLPCRCRGADALMISRLRGLNPRW
jgi:hypothetical protein